MDVIKQLRDDVTASKRKRKEYLDTWQRNIDERRGKPFATESDEARSAVPVDWTVTKTKAAQLFSQMPTVRLTPKHPDFAPAVPVFAKVVNDTLKAANLEATMGECVVDCVNAAGIGATIIRYEALSDVVQEPAIDLKTLSPEAQEAIATGQFQVPTVDVDRKTDWRICIDRISPQDLLWPSAFRLSNWNKAPWLGHSARGTWPEVSRKLGLAPELKDKVVNAGDPTNRDQLNVDNDARRTAVEELVEYDEVFYWRYLYHEDEKYYDAIQRVVFVHGLDEPVIDEPWTGQQFDEQNGGYLGSCYFPIQVLTLTYISDEAIPPSDSAIIRPQVKELQESRQHMREQRKHSRPLRWFDVDRVDPTMMGDLINGTWQGMIPTIGAGDKVIGEVARSAYPRVNMEFDRILKNDIQEAVSVGPNQAGTFASGERSASEAQIVQQSFQTEIGQQRAKVAAMVVRIAEIVAGLIALHVEIDPVEIGASIGAQGVERLQASWDRTRINQKFVFDIRADSTVRVDAQQLLQQIERVINITVQSGFVNPKPLIQKILELNGVDPAEVMVDPQPKGPEPPKISYSFKGEDLLNPFAVAIILEANHGPSAKAIEAAQTVIAGIVQPQPPMGAPGAAPAGPGGPPPMGGPGMPPPPPPSGPQAGPGGPPPITDPAVPEKPLPQWEMAPRLNTRRQEDM